MDEWLLNLKVGDPVRVFGSLPLRNINEIRKVARILKYVIVDDKGGRWDRKWGTQKGVQYPTVSIINPKESVS